MNTYSLASLCLLVVALLPYLATLIAKWGRRDFNNHDPRTWLATLEGFRKRANAAQMNAFEAQASFYAAVILNLVVGTAASSVNTWALVFVAMRVLHLAFYLTDRAMLRSLAFLGGLSSVVALFVTALVHVK